MNYTPSRAWAENKKFNGGLGSLFADLSCQGLFQIPEGSFVCRSSRTREGSFSVALLDLSSHEMEIQRIPCMKSAGPGLGR